MSALQIVTAKCYRPGLIVGHSISNTHNFTSGKKWLFYVSHKLSY